MNKKFLYKKPSIIGVLDDSDNEFYDLGSWFLDDSWSLLKKRFRESPIDELVIELVDIFREGNPNYQELAVLFGYGNMEENNEEKIMRWSLREIDRMNQDIIKVEMHVDAQSLILRNLYLFVKELPSLQSLKNKLNELHKDIAFQERNNGFMLAVRECIITILKNI